jgi:hypothetical protein
MALGENNNETDVTLLIQRCYTWGYALGNGNGQSPASGVARLLEKPLAGLAALPISINLQAQVAAWRLNLALSRG